MTEPLTHAHKLLSVVRMKQNKCTDSTGATQGGKSKSSAKILETSRGKKDVCNLDIYFSEDI